MIYATYTLANLITIEITFFFAEKFISRKKLLSGFITTLIVGFIILVTSFGGWLFSIFIHIERYGNSFTVIEWLVGLLNCGYAFLYGSNRIAKINKKYGNL